MDWCQLQNVKKEVLAFDSQLEVCKLFLHYSGDATIKIAIG